jgi:hypothetical protein
VVALDNHLHVRCCFDTDRLCNAPVDVVTGQ